MLHKPSRTQTSTDFMRERLKKAELKFSRNTKVLRQKDMPRYQKVWRQTFLQLVDSDVPLARHHRDTIKRELASHWFPPPAKERNAKHLAERDWFYRAAIKEYAKRLDVPETKAKAHYFRAWGFPSVAALNQFLKRQHKKRYKKL
jgi:hypothetical protein